MTKCKTFVYILLSAERRPYDVRMRSFLTYNCPFTPAAHVFVRRWSLAECHFNASRGASRMGVFSGHSAGVGGAFKGVVRVSVSPAFVPAATAKTTLCRHASTHLNTHTHTNVLKICPNLYLN